MDIERQFCAYECTNESCGIVSSNELVCSEPRSLSVSMNVHMDQADDFVQASMSVRWGLSSLFNEPQKEMTDTSRRLPVVSYDAGHAVVRKCCTRAPSTSAHIECWYRRCFTSVDVFRTTWTQNEYKCTLK